MAQKEEICSYWQEDYDVASEMVKNKQEIVIVKANQLRGFKDHPFKVEYNSELFELMRSIETDGILVPLLVRPHPDGTGYEIIAGHRRKAACEWAEITDIPVIIRNLSNRQAVIAMVNSNLQRENIKPSEKAFAYKMRLEAMKQQGKRTDLTFSQVEKKLNNVNPTVQLAIVECDTDGEGIWKISNGTEEKKNRYSNDILAKQVGESRAQIARYIRLTNLIPKLLDMVDEGKIAFTIAVELSYLKEEEQYELHAVMDMEQCSPSLSQANRLKRLSQTGKLDMDEIYHVLEEEKPNQRPQIKIRADRLEEYFPENYTDKQKVELIEKLVMEWYEHQPLQTKKDKKR